WAAMAFVLQRGIKAVSGIRGPTGMYSWSTRFFFDNGIVSMTAWASSTVFASIKKITPLPSPLEYHWRIVPSRYSFTVARISAGMMFMICCRVTPCLAVSITITSVVLGDGASEGGWADGD